MRRQPGRHLLSAALIFFIAVPAFAKGSHGDNNRSSFGSNITVSEGESVGDVACAFCSVHIRGEVTGDVAVAFGSITVEPGHTIAGDTAVLLGDINLGEGSSVNGDVAIMAGDTHLADGATIRGSRAVVPQPIGTLILLAPFLVLAGLIWLIVHFVRRRRYTFPVYPQGRGIQPPPR